MERDSHTAGPCAPRVLERKRNRWSSINSVLWTEDRSPCSSFPARTSRFSPSANSSCLYISYTIVVHTCVLYYGRGRSPRFARSQSSGIRLLLGTHCCPRRFFFFAWLPPSPRPVRPSDRLFIGQYIDRAESRPFYHFL
jgi:hypothetical protein